MREQLGLTGSKEGCDDSECGACMMLVDGRPTNSCSYLAIQADGASITTVEGLGDGDDLSPLQAAFLEEGGVQCGFCTPGMLISATALLAANPSPSAGGGPHRPLRQPLPLHGLRRPRARGPARLQRDRERLTRSPEGVVSQLRGGALRRPRRCGGG